MARAHLTVLAACGITLGTGAVAGAQIAPPPRTAPEGLTRPTAPGLTPARTPLNRGAEPATESVERYQESIARTEWEKARARMLDALVRQDEDGRLIRLDGLPEVEAIRVYPEARRELLDTPLPERFSEGETVYLRERPIAEDLLDQPELDQEALEQIEVAIADRRYRLEESVIANLEPMRELTGGLIQNISPFDREAMGRARDLVRLVKPEDTLYDDLIEQGLLVESMREDLAGIANRYRSELRNEYIRPGGGDDSENAQSPNLPAATRLFWREQIAEPLRAYEGLLLETSRHLDELPDRLNLGEQARQRFAEAREQLEGADERTRIERMKKLANSLPLEEHRALLMQTRVLRGW